MSDSAEPPARLPYWPWVAAWLLGFAGIALLVHPGSLAVIGPAWLPLTSLYALVAIAGVVSGVRLARRPGRDGARSWLTGLQFSTAVLLGAAVLAATMYLVTYTLPAADALLLSCACLLGLGSFGHMVAGALWPDQRMFRLGLWLTIVNFVALTDGLWTHPRVVVALGGGGLLVGALARRIGRGLTWQARRARGRLAQPGMPVETAGA